jgi:hypothetical protein
VTILGIVPAMNADEVFAMDALFAAELIASQCRRNAAVSSQGQAERDSRGTRNADGTTTHRIGSMSDLASMFKRYQPG